MIDLQQIKLLSSSQSKSFCFKTTERGASAERIRLVLCRQRYARLRLRKSSPFGLKVHIIREYIYIFAQLKLELSNARKGKKEK
jgi:hypothetical protein